jgi:cytochrome c oxidase assembly factor 2
MPPHLHPRSRLTSSLFATTLLASFLVVGLPHALPCPAPRVAYADGPVALNPDGTPRRRRRRKVGVPSEESAPASACLHAPKVVEQVSDEEDTVEEDMPSSRRERRECPVPKPGGIVGQILGFRKDSSTDGSGRPPTT